MKKLFERITFLEDFLASSKFAVGLLVIATIYFAVATIIESIYGARFASLLFYQSIGMGILSFFAVLSIFFAITKRMTLSKKNFAFQVMHWGILVVFAGGYFTYDAGIDGMLTLYPGESNNKVVFKQKEIAFIPHDEGKDPVTLPLPDAAFATELNQNFKGITFSKYLPFAKDELIWRASTGASSAYFELIQEGNVVAPLVFSHSENSRFRHEAEAGPLRIYFLPKFFESFFSKYEWSKDKECFDVLADRPIAKKMSDVPAARRSCFDIRSLMAHPTIAIFGDSVSLYNRQKNAFVPYEHFTRDEIHLPWMNLSLKKIKLSTTEYPTLGPVASLPKAKDEKGEIFSAISMDFGDESFWLREGSEEVVRLKDGIFSVGISRKQHNLPFQVYLNKFEILKDETGTPSSYQSRVDIYDVEGRKSSHLISMNRPLKIGKFTLYQSSYFQIGKDAYASTLSVNYDPGRIYKYLGSFLLIIGGFLYYLFAIRPTSEFKDD